MIPLANIIYPLFKKTPKKIIIAGDPFQIEPITAVDLWRGENTYTMVRPDPFKDPKTMPYLYKVEFLTTQYPVFSCPCRFCVSFCSAPQHLPPSFFWAFFKIRRIPPHSWEMAYRGRLSSFSCLRKFDLEVRTPKGRPLFVTKNFRLFAIRFSSALTSISIIPQNFHRIGFSPRNK